jgi:hypothetical protein
VLPGETLSFHVSSAAPYTIRIFRQGSFAGGATEQMMAQVGGQRAVTPPFPIGRNAYKDGAQWPVATSYVVPNWPSGLYLARIQDTASPPHVVDVPFVVRAPSVSQSKVLLVISDTTYEAYNDWGGRSVYGSATERQTAGGPQRGFVGSFPSAAAARVPFGFELSFQRPFANGLGNAPKWQLWESPTIRWMMQQGIPFDVCTARDVHFEAPTVPNYRLLLFVGHHEYWSSEMRDHVEGFALAGGGVAFFSGNVSWWQIRLSADGDTLTCYKVAGFDPMAGIDPSLVTTNWWNLPGAPRPETALTGLSWYGSVVINDSAHQFLVTDATHWALAGTNLANNALFGLYAGGSVVGGEIDRIQHGGPNGMESPANFAVAARVFEGNTTYELGTMGSFTPAGSNGEVFSAATLNWALGLTDTNPANPVPRITLNAIDRLGPRFRPVQGAGFASDVGVAANGQVWIVSNTPVNGGFSIQKLVGTSWATISGGAMRIAVGPNGNPWVVNSVNAIFRLVAGSWKTMPGTATDIGVGANGSVWAIGTAPANGGHPIVRWTGSGWAPTGGNGVRIAVDPHGNAWVVNSVGAIFEYVAGTWRNHPGLAIDIGVGPDGSVWVVGSVGSSTGHGNEIYRWNGADWRRVPGGATNIAVGLGGKPWSVDAQHALHFWD